eukprot:CAMPEP_0201478624 /NCGR_PEP_ID=MMETSP0151_2-20130828/3412_1 /ASSEMBLY_ACC=CAM_ASM_000257 /TAXON_ID=200890 /ORGANISM="Paramoeba atlantica, Strain 621/1 / CCAP 1560/9" /LENGTH=128 /DNA_ID=CAMNT_0047859749 /DNA_START=158 /DNA_END=544 /DNA_ORIENTATION=-
MNRAALRLVAVLAAIVIGYSAGMMKQIFWNTNNQTEKKNTETVSGLENREEGENLFVSSQNRIEEKTSPHLPETSHHQEQRYPLHWGDPPTKQTRDIVKLPGGYGFGSSTLANWIKFHLKEDEGFGDD